MAKGTLDLKNKVDDYLQRVRIYALGNNLSELANGMIFIGMLIGLYLLVLILVHNPITKIFLSNYKTIICKFISIKDYIIHYKNIINSPPPPPPHEEAPRSHQDEAIKLANLGLACIGRKTKRTNLYLTPEREAERHKAEYIFLRQLAEKYRDAATRKVLAQHFMLFKEFCLHIIFSVVLKGDAELHKLVKDELHERLMEGLSNRVKLVRGILQMLQDFTEWKVLCPIALIASVLLLFCKIQPIHIILGSMFETIRGAIAFILMLTIAGISYKCVEVAFFYTKSTIEKYLLQQFIERTQRENEATDISYVHEALSKLPDLELTILKYMHEKKGIIWLPVKEGAVLNLYETGCIYFAINVSMLRGDILAEYSQCFACKLNPKLENNISKLSIEIKEKWDAVETASWLSVYEHAIN